MSDNRFLDQTFLYPQLVAQQRIAAGPATAGLVPVAQGVGFPYAVWGPPPGSASPLFAKGDIYTHDSTVDARLPAGSDNQIIIYDSSTGTGLKAANITPIVIGATTGKDRNRPAANAGTIYFSSDTKQQYFSDGSIWYVGGKGSDRCYFDSLAGGFSDAIFGQSSAGATAGPTFATGTSMAVMFKVLSLPGVGGGIVASLVSGALTSGWIFGNSTVNANKLRFVMTGVNATASIEINATLTTGVHVFAANYTNGTNIRFSLDGAAVGTAAVTGTYTVPSAASNVWIGRYAGGAGFSCPWMGFMGLQGYNSLLSDADLQTLGGQTANCLFGNITTDPSYDLQARWCPDGSYASGTPGFSAYGTAATKVCTLGWQGGGVFKSNL